ncbi:adhesive plaque matrix protein, partial [Aphis craccivora]
MAARPRDITITHISVPIGFVLLPAKSFISYSRPVPEPTELSSPKILQASASRKIKQDKAMKSFSAFCYAVCALTVIGSTRCEPAAEDDGTPTDKASQANRRSYGEYHGLYAPAYHAHYAPASYHGHYAPASTHYHSYGYASPTHYHGHGYAAPAHYHGHGYAPAHYHGHYYNHHETTVHGFKHQPVVYQSVVHTYPTATTVVHKPVPVPVAHPVPVPVVRPVPVEVPRPYPVPVNRPYPVAVIKPVAVPVAQPYPVTVYKPYPVPVYRPTPAVVPVARPAATAVHYAARLPVRIPLVRYPATPSYLHHSHAYAPQYRGAVAYPGQSSYQGQSAYQGPSSYQVPTAYQGSAYPADAPTSYLQQLAALRAAGGSYEVNEAAAAAQQQTLQDEYSFLQEQRDVGATDVHHHDDDAAHHHHLHHDHHGLIDQDSGLGSGAGYPPLTAETKDCGGVAHQQSTRNSRTRIENDISFKSYSGSPSLGRRVPRDDDFITKFVSNIVCTHDVNLSMFMYLVNHLTSQECVKLTAYLYAEGLELTAVKELEQDLPLDETCLSLLVTWNNSAGKEKNFLNIADCLRKINHKKLAEWLSDTVFTQLTWKKTQRHAIFIYADFKALLKKSDEKCGNNTKAIQKHEAMSYSFMVKANNGVPKELLEQFNIPTSPIIFRGDEDNQNADEHFVKSIIEIAENIEKLLQTNIPITFTAEQQQAHNLCETCNLCKNGFSVGNHKVADHCHLSGIRGGLTQASMRYVKANNKKTPDYDPTKPKSWLIYEDCNNLYGWAMSQYMPHSGFKWVEPKLEGLNDLNDTSPIGRTYEVGITYPKELHDQHNDLSFLPQNSIPAGSKVKKLIATLQSKKNYITHYQNLQQAMANGLIVEKVHRVVQFNQSPWLAPYIALNTEMRKKAANDFEKDFLKLLNNAVFRKTMESMWKRIKMELVSSDRRLQKLINQSTFKHYTTYNKTLNAVALKTKSLIF